MGHIAYYTNIIKGISKVIKCTGKTLASFREYASYPDSLLFANRKVFLSNIVCLKYRCNHAYVFCVCLLSSLICRTNIKLANVYALAFGFSQGIVFMIYAGAFRFGAYLVTLGEITPDNVYKLVFFHRYSKRQ